MLTLTFLGTSSGVPTRKRNVSGLAVQSSLGREWFLFDCGEGTQHRLQQARLSLHDLAAVCISHVHGDHCYGLPGLLGSAAMAGRQRPLTLIAPLPVWEWLTVTRACTDMHLPYALVQVDVASAPPPLWDAGGIRIEAHPLRHRVPSFAYAVTAQSHRTRLDADALRAVGLPPGPLWQALLAGEDVYFEGRMLKGEVYAARRTQRVRAVIGGDNAEPGMLDAACEGAQLLVHEATYTQPVLDKVGPGPMHSSAGQVAAFAQAAGLSNLVLTHFSPRYHDAAGLGELEAEARTHYGGRLWLAEDLDVFDLNAEGVLDKRQEKAGRRT
jgi:ribonuclease Z